MHSDMLNATLAHVDCVYPLLAYLACIAVHMKVT